MQLNFPLFSQFVIFYYLIFYFLFHLEIKKKKKKKNQSQKFCDCFPKWFASPIHGIFGLVMAHTAENWKEKS